MNPFTPEVVCKLLRNTKSLLRIRKSPLLHYLKSHQHNKVVIIVLGCLSVCLLPPVWANLLSKTEQSLTSHPPSGLYL